MCSNAGPSSTAPKTRNVTLSSAAPVSSVKRIIPAALSPASRPNSAPATNAAMNPEPPRTFAIPYEHRRGQGDDLLPRIVDQASSSGNDHNRRGEHAGGEAAEQPVADLLGEHPHR